MRWVGHVALIRAMRNAYKILVGKPEGRRKLRCTRRWEDNIEMGLKRTGSEDVDFIHVIQDRYQWRALADRVMNLLVP
jgi:hypothetical protein